jgi:hypothetical protein
MQFPLSFSDISLWLAATAIILLTASELIPFYSDRLGYLLVSKKRLRQAALAVGAAFVATVIFRVVGPV